MTATGVRFGGEAERRKLGAMTAGELRRRYQEIGGDEACSRARGRPRATDGSRGSVGPSPKVSNQRVDVALDHGHDAGPLDREVTVHQPIAQADDRTQVRDAVLDRIVKSGGLVERLPDRDQVPFDRGADDPVFPKAFRAHFVADRHDLLRGRERIEQIDTNLTLLHREASGRGGRPPAGSDSSPR